MWSWQTAIWRWEHDTFASLVTSSVTSLLSHQIRLFSISYFVPYSWIANMKLLMLMLMLVIVTKRQTRKVGFLLFMQEMLLFRLLLWICSLLISYSLHKLGSWSKTYGRKHIFSAVTFDIIRVSFYSFGEEYLVIKFIYFSLQKQYLV